jgi:hypothetical protein
MNATKIIIGIALAVHVYFSIPVIIADPWLATFFEIFENCETWAFQITSDLFLGFLLFAIMIYLVEGSLKTAVWWFVGINLIGNPAAAIYVLINMNKIQKKLA